MADPTIHDVLAAVAGLREATTLESASLRAGLSSLHEDLSSLRADLTSFRADLTSLHEDLTSVHADLSSLHEDLTSVHADLSLLHAGVGSLREDTNGLRIDIMGRMDRLQDALTIQRDELVVNYGAAERAERLARAAQDEVRVLGEMVTPMVRQIRRLQEEVRILRGDT